MRSRSRTQCGGKTSRCAECGVPAGRSADRLDSGVWAARALRSGSVLPRREGLVRLSRSRGRGRTACRLGALRQLLVPGRCGGKRRRSLCSARQGAHRARRLAGHIAVYPLASRSAASPSTQRGGKARAPVARSFRGASRFPHRPVRFRTDPANAKPRQREANGRLPKAAVVLRR